MRRTRSKISRDATPIWKEREEIRIFWQERNVYKNGLITDKDIEYIQKTTLEYMISCRSKNELAAHFREMEIPVSIYIINQFLDKLYGLVREFNHRLDETIRSLIHTIEIDETFKGMKIQFFESIDHLSGYILRLDLINSRDFDSLLPYYNELATSFDYVKRIITDLAPVYPRLIEETFGQIDHQLCQIHATRVILKDITKVLKDYNCSLKKKQNLEDRLKAAKKKRKSDQNKLYKLNDELKTLINERDSLRIQYGVRPYQKNIWKRYPQLHEQHLKIQKQSAIIRGLNKTLKNSKTKITNLKAELAMEIKNKNTKWSVYMRYRKVLRITNAYFKNEIKTQLEFESKINGLTKNAFPDFNKKVINLINKHPRLGTYKKHLNFEESLDELISTNKIESLNDRFKPFKDSRRKWVQSDSVKGFLELLRLKFNFSRPLVNNGQNFSPLEKLGFNLQGKSLYEVLFHHSFPINIELENSIFCLSLKGGQIKEI